MDVIPFKFQNVALRESCWIDRKPYFTRRAIGEWLGYTKPRPDVAIAKIVARCPHIKPFSTVTKLVTVEGDREVEREVEVYDPIGLQLIVMESHQPKAIGYKIAVAHMVAAYMRGDLKPCRPTHQRFFVAMKGFEDAEKTAHGHRMESWEKAAFESGRSIKTLYRWRKRFKERGTLCYDYRYKAN